MVNKTYEQRLNDLAEEMAKLSYEEQFTGRWEDKDTDSRNVAISLFMASARIAIKHMAEAYRMAVDEDGAHRKYGLDEYLISLGYKPQTT